MTPRQHALLRVARSQLGLGDADYRQILQECGGVASARDLDILAFDRVMYRMRALGFRSPSDRRNFGARPGMASPGQVHAIRTLWAEWSGAEDEAAMGRWLESRYKVSALRFLTARHAGKAVEGLKAMVARKAARAS